MELNMETMEMSLDEYIAMSNKKSNNFVFSSNKNKNRTSENNDPKFGRRKGNIDDEDEEDEYDLLKSDEDEDILIKSVEDEDTLLKSDEDEVKDEVDTGIWKGPSAAVAYIDCHDQQNDLREKLNTNSNRNKFNEISSVQYRLMAPNNSADRPRGIPTLLPLDAYVHNNYNNNNGYTNKRYRNRNRRGNRGFNNQNYKNNYNHYNNNSYDNNRNAVGGVSNGRVQRNRGPNFSQNTRHSLNSANGNFKAGPSQGLPKNIAIEFPSNSINLESDGHLKPSLRVPHSAPNADQHKNRSKPVGNLTPQAKAALDLDTSPNPVSNSSNDNLKALLGFQNNVSGELMPAFASRLLEYLQNGAQSLVHKPMYDMKVQKDIHEIQNKPLLYKCNGGEVISSDGAGVNCEIIPRTSGISLNCRFA